MIQYKYAETSDSGFEFDCGSNSAGYVELYHPCGHSSVRGFGIFYSSLCADAGGFGCACKTIPEYDREAGGEEELYVWCGGGIWTDHVIACAIIGVDESIDGCVDGRVCILGLFLSEQAGMSFRGH